MAGISDLGGMGPENPLEGKKNQSPTGTDIQGREFSQLFSDSLPPGLVTECVLNPQPVISEERQAYIDLSKKSNALVSDIRNTIEEVHKKQKEIGDPISLFKSDQRDALEAAREKKLSSLGKEGQKEYRKEYDQLELGINRVWMLEGRQKTIASALDFLDSANRTPEVQQDKLGECSSIIGQLTNSNLQEEAGLFTKALPDSIKSQLRSREVVAKTQPGAMKRALTVEYTKQLEEERKGVTTPSVEYKKHRSKKEYIKERVEVAKDVSGLGLIKPSDATRNCLDFLKNTVPITEDDVPEIQGLIEQENLTDSCKQMFLGCLPPNIKDML